MPDVVTLDPMWAGDLIRDGALAPLEGIETTINPADFVAGGWQLCGYRGKQYGVPADMDFNLIFYRKDVYDPAIAAAGLTGFPTSTEDFIKVAQAISTDDAKAILLAQSDYYGWYQGFLVPYGGRLVSEDGSEVRLQLPRSRSPPYNSTAIWRTNTAWRVLWDETLDGTPIDGSDERRCAGRHVWLVVCPPNWPSAAPEMAGQWGVAPDAVGSRRTAKYTPRQVAPASRFPPQPHATISPAEFVAYLEQPEVMATYYRRRRWRSGAANLLAVHRSGCRE